MSGQLYFQRFSPRERAPGTHWIGGWVGHRTGVDDMEERKMSTLPGLELCPAAIQPIARCCTDSAIPALPIEPEYLKVSIPE
jgi:hypothetical protein